jgi:flagellar hook-associated protein 3 FlgL
MRVNPDYTADLLSAIWKTQEDEKTAIQQLASGKRVSVPSDDPAAAAALVLNQGARDRDDVYLQSVSSLKAQLQTADSTLDSVVTSLTRAITLGTKGATTTNSPENRKAIAQDIQGVFGNILLAANTQYQGAYLFAGTAVTSAPYSQPDANNNVTYSGNDQKSSVAVGNSGTMVTNVSGKELFGDPADPSSPGTVFTSLQHLIKALNDNDTNAIQTANTEVSAALAHMSTARVFYGNASKQLSSAESYLKTDQVNLASQENDLIGIDVTKAATNLSKAVTANNAAMSAFAKMSQKTLLDYL